MAVRVMPMPCPNGPPPEHIEGLDDIPAQIGRVVRFSVRSTTSFVLSFVTASS